MLSNNVAHIARLIGDDTRASILIALMGGSALTAGELAVQANISAQTASNHLKKLTTSKLLVCEAAGRHRYYKLASKEVAELLESLGVFSGFQKKQRPPGHHLLENDLCFARTCYDHLAGELGVKLTKALAKHKFILLADGRFTVTEKGRAFFDSIGIDIDSLLKQKRQFSKACLDWTEREYHLAGSLGSALLNYLIKNRFLLKAKKKPRVILLTEKGRQWFRSELNLFDLKNMNTTN